MCPPSSAADRRCVCGGGHSRPHTAEDLQEVQEDQAEAQRTQEAAGASVEHPPPGRRHHSGGVCGADHHVVPAVGLPM